MQTYLLVWLYVGIHNLAGLWGTAQRQQSKQQGGFTHAPPAWQAAAGMLAAQGTPWEILAGADVLNAGDNFGERYPDLLLETPRSLAGQAGSACDNHHVKLLLIRSQTAEVSGLLDG